MSRPLTKSSPEHARQMQASDGVQYVAEEFRCVTPSKNGVWNYLEIRASYDGGATWEALPWAAHPFCPGRYLNNEWPPTEMALLRESDGALEIEYFDDEWPEVSTKAVFNARKRQWWVSLQHPLFIRKRTGGD
jgi:hypothetical protein